MSAGMDAARMAAEWEIERLIRRFALLNDAGHAEALAALFTEDGAFYRPSEPDTPVSGRAAIAAHFRDRPKRVTRHLVVNTVVDLDGPERARADSYIVLYTAASGPLPATADAVQLVGSFADRLERAADGAWRFAERRGSLALKTASA
jgi:ketosteroid isomerase-like protein